jgi:hypothetical protein
MEGLYILNMKLIKSNRFRIYFLVFAFVASLAGNTYACLFPFSAQIERTAMPCDTSELSASGASSHTDEACNQALLDEGRVSHFNSFSQLTFLRIGQATSMVSSLVGQSVLAPQESSLFSINRRHLTNPAKYLSVPIYTSNHTFLI